MLLGAALGGVPAAGASVGFVRTDVALPAAPDSVALGDLDGVNGKDIVVGLWSPGKVGVMLNQGDGRSPRWSSTPPDRNARACSRT